MNKHVLVIADIEDDDFLSLEKARDIASDISATLEIIKFTHYDCELHGTVVEHVANVEQNLHSVINDIFPSEAEVFSKVVLKEDIDEWMVERCHQYTDPIDLVIKGGHRTESLFHTPTDWKLIRHLHCPILIASHTKWKSRANILMALDLAHKDEDHEKLNNAVIEWGRTWSQATHTKLHAMYSIPIAKPLLELDIVDEEEIEKKKAPAAQEELRTLLAQYDLDSVACHTPAGPPDKVIPHLAGELHSDLIIMGCVGREGINGLLFGNTAEKVLHHVRTDCLIIKLPRYASAPT